jgi:hypothetical protein
MDLDTVIEYLGYIAIVSCAFSFGAIKSYLVKKELVKWKLAYSDPFDFFGKYISSTKQETGKVGIWFWNMIISGLLAIFLFTISE